MNLYLNKLSTAKGFISPQSIIFSKLLRSEANAIILLFIE